MWCLRFFILSGLTVASLCGQSIFNAYGLGLTRTAHHASSIGAGSIGLVPVFHPGVSMDNPATWPGSKFTFVSGNYSTQGIKRDGIKGNNKVDQLEKIQFVVPFGTRFAWGLSLNPLTNQNSYLMTDTTEFEFEGDAVYSYKELRTGGGIMSFSSGIAFPLSKGSGGGIMLDYIFGSSRDEQVMDLNSFKYRLFNIRTYSGTLLKFYWGGQVYQNQSVSLQGYASVGSSPKPVSMTTYRFQPFEDINGNYVYDDSDYPDSLEVDTTRVRYAYNPKHFSLGLNATFKNDLNVFAEGLWWQDNAFGAKTFSVWDDRVSDKTHYGVGLVWFGNQASREILDRFYYRAGLYQDKYGLKNSGKTINENGLSVGIGFKFAATGNQLDFSYRTGSRSIDGGYKELIQEFTVGVTLGDVWFLRRRAKQ